MVPPWTSPAPEESSAFARRRDALIIALLENHPATAEMLVGLGWFPNRSKVVRRLTRLVARGKVRLLGTVAGRAGRPQHVYGRWRPALNQLTHEILLTQVCLRLSASRILRGHHIERRDLLPDAEVWIQRRRYYLELDRGTMSYAQLERRFGKYAETDEFVLWVCSSIDRREGMRARAGMIRQAALFTTLPEALVDPHAPIWIDHAGHQVGLPREDVMLPRQSPRA